MEGFPGYVGATLIILYFKSYHHLGHSRGSFVIELINRLLGVGLKAMELISFLCGKNVAAAKHFPCVFSCYKNILESDRLFN